VRLLVFLAIIAAMFYAVIQAAGGLRAVLGVGSLAGQGRSLDNRFLHGSDTQ